MEDRRKCPKCGCVIYKIYLYTLLDGESYRIDKRCRCCSEEWSDIRSLVEKRSGYRHVIMGGKQIPLHRWVYEQHYKEKLSREDEIHHINWIKYDNRVVNLLKVGKKEHENTDSFPILISKIEAYKKRINTLERELSRYANRDFQET